MSTNNITLTFENGLDIVMTIQEPPSLSFALDNTAEFQAAVGTIAKSVNDYETLMNLPSIEGATLIGSLSLEDINVIPLTNMEIEELLSGAV